VIDAESHCETVTFRAARVVTDPVTAALLDHAIETRGGRIARIYPARQLAPGTTVHDLGDAVLTAGIIDAHVHLGFDGSPHPEATMCSGGTTALRELVSNKAAAMVRAGVTTVRDLGCAGTTVTQLAREWRSDPHYPRVVAANQPLTTTGGHCSYMATECDDLGQLLEAVSQRRREGAAVIKVMLTGGFMHAEGDTPYRSVYDLHTLEHVVKAAHDQGMAVAAHAHGTRGIIVAAHARVDTIEHCSMAAPGGVDIDDYALTLLAQRGTFAIPTVSSVWNQPLPWAARDEAIGVISRLNEAGVPIALGTDTGIPDVMPGDHVAGLRVLEEAGLSAQQLWAAATTTAAAACRLSEHVGRLAPGYVADLLVLDADPREDLSTLERVQTVYRSGCVASTSEVRA
jgi:imidazolonepropionase-like amidohydrolase